MSKESHLSKRIKEAFALLWKDIWTLRYAILVFAVYVFMGRYMFYSICPVVNITGFPCPGCGMTRAVFAVCRGDFAFAWKLHPFVYVLIGYVVIFAFRRYVLQKEVKSMIQYLIVIAVAMIGYYIYRMIRFFPGEAPMSYYYGSILYQLLKRK